MRREPPALPSAALGAALPNSENVKSLGAALQQLAGRAPAAQTGGWRVGVVIPGAAAGNLGTWGSLGGGKALLVHGAGMVAHPCKAMGWWLHLLGVSSSPQRLCAEDGPGAQQTPRLCPAHHQPRRQPAGGQRYLMAPDQAHTRYLSLYPSPLSIPGSPCPRWGPRCPTCSWCGHPGAEGFCSHQG